MSLSEPRRPSGLIPQTIIASRVPGLAGWSLRALKCEPKDLHLWILSDATQEREYREVGFTYCHPSFAHQALKGIASKAGWQLHHQTSHWFPINEPIPASNGRPRRSGVSVRLRTIDCGCIGFEVGALARSVQLFFDDIEDSLVLFVRFLQILQAGGEPHAALADNAGSHLFVHKTSEPDLCRFRLETVERGAIDVITERAQLLEEFRGLATAIADHPWFGHLFVCHCELPEAEYERVATAAEGEWEARFGKACWSEDAEDYVRDAVCSNVSLSEQSLAFVDQQRAMLRILAIPDELALISTQ